jgi:hypothetical protein
MAYGRKTGGRQAGTPNKATAGARRAVSEIVEGNSHKLSKWLHSVAEGIRMTDPITGYPTNEYLIRPNPAKAFDMYHSLLEFHVPKLTRVQVSGQIFDTHSADANWEIFSNLLQSIKEQRQLESADLKIRKD